MAVGCTITGTENDDHLAGTAGADVICAFGGDDVVQGFGGPDIVDGGLGADDIDGGAGTDLLLGLAGVDRMVGGLGGDYLNGGADGGDLWGSEGADACVSGTPVSCYPPSFGDPNDTGGRFDVRRVRSWAGASPPRWKIVTGRTWTTKQIWDRGYVVLFADTIGTPAPDYHVLAYSKGSGMSGGLYRETQNGGEVRIGAASVSKPGARAVEVRLPLTKLNRNRPFFRWSIQTLFTGPKCQKVCFDHVPGGASLPQAVLAEV
jgi:hypothetical protein